MTEIAEFCVGVCKRCRACLGYGSWVCFIEIYVVTVGGVRQCWADMAS